MKREDIEAFYNEHHDALMADGRLVDGPYKLVFNNNKTRAGVCYFDPPKICISNVFISSHNINDDDIKDVLLHELAHAMTGPDVENPHGEEWKKFAKEIGCTGNRCSKPFVDSKKPLYLVACPKGCKLGRHRAPTKFIGKTKRCAKHSQIISVFKFCGGKYEKHIIKK